MITQLPNTFSTDDATEGPADERVTDAVGISDHANKAVCNGKVELIDAQQAIADDWQTIEKCLGIG